MGKASHHQPCNTATIILGCSIITVKTVPTMTTSSITDAGNLVATGHIDGLDIRTLEQWGIP